jgi:hypothetical protein
MPCRRSRYDSCGSADMAVDDGKWIRDDAVRPCVMCRHSFGSEWTTPLQRSITGGAGAIRRPSLGRRRPRRSCASRPPSRIRTSASLKNVRLLVVVVVVVFYFSIHLKRIAEEMLMRCRVRICSDQGRYPCADLSVDVPHQLRVARCRHKGHLCDAGPRRLQVQARQRGARPELLCDRLCVRAEREDARVQATTRTPILEPLNLSVEQLSSPTERCWKADMEPMTVLISYAA